MRKLGTIGALVMAAAILFTSCEKIETSEVTLDLSQTATVKVKLFADLNLTTQGNELVPNGTNVIISIPNSSFNATATGLWTTTAVVANGLIEATVPTTNNGVIVTFTPAEFIYDQVQSYPAVSSTLPKKFNALTGTLTVKPGETKYLEMSYTPSNIAVTVTVSRKFELRAEINETTAGTETVPQGTIVTFYATFGGWSSTATVPATGKVDISVPIGESISARFEAIKTLTAPATPKNYRYDITIGTWYESSPVTQVVNFGNGTPWE